MDTGEELIADEAAKRRLRRQALKVYFESVALAAALTLLSLLA